MTVFRKAFEVLRILQFLGVLRTTSDARPRVWRVQVWSVQGSRVELCEADGPGSQGVGFRSFQMSDVGLVGFKVAPQYTAIQMSLCA